MRRQSASEDAHERATIRAARAVEGDARQRIKFAPSVATVLI
jgi:hypothetical protein